MPKIAVVQMPSILLDRHRTIEKAVQLVDESAAAGAELVVFPEAFIPGYPVWIWRLRPGSDRRLADKLYARLLENAVDIDADDLVPLYDAASRHKVTIVCGINERDGRLSRATLYNTVVVIGAHGAIENRHRKLMPTNPERMVWGFGDGSGLNVVDTPVGRIGTLVCWENYMPLARYTLYSQGVQIYVAPTYDGGEAWTGTMQHIAREGRCWVIGSGVVLQAGDLPSDFPGKEQIYPDPDEWINTGDSVVIAPGGELAAGPMHKEKGVLYADVDATSAGVARRTLDVAGHYARPDIFTLHVNKGTQAPIEFE